MYELSKLRILVISFTNHAIDQFLEDLLDIGIPGAAMVRLGSKSTLRTRPLLLQNSARTGGSEYPWDFIDSTKEHQQDISQQLQSEFRKYLSLSISFTDIIEYLEFSEHERYFYDAFLVPSDDKEWKRVGRKGKKITPDYLYARWIQGSGPGIFTDRVTTDLEKVWDMTLPQRQGRFLSWAKAMTQEHVETIQKLATDHNTNLDILSDLFDRGKINALTSKRIIGCTTTAAAMHSYILRAANPDVILVEEAGEILESHILTALAPSVRQVILIGDHKQLRPKVNNYKLSVEKGGGYNLNMSLFERLLTQGYEHTTLKKQHRMHPEISLFPRKLTYSELVDGSKTANRPIIRGLQDRVIFINHEHEETGNSVLADRRDQGSNISKENVFEATMVLKMVRYLAQQGYQAEQMVVLTPYLGQLQLLRETLKSETDVVLKDFDASELLRAGLMTRAASKVDRQPLRLSTIGQRIQALPRCWYKC
jgi:hypothetical protein